MKNDQPPGPKVFKATKKIPVILLAIVTLENLVCGQATFSKWTVVNWLLFLIPYLLLVIFSILWIYHWHRKECIKEKRKLMDVYNNEINNPDKKQRKKNKK